MSEVNILLYGCCPNTHLLRVLANVMQNVGRSIVVVSSDDWLQIA